MCGYVFCSVDELKVLSEEELVERALHEAMEVASTDNQLALITLFWIAFSFEALMFFLSRTRILVLSHNQRIKHLMEGKWLL
jgi:hypothetical protein